MSKRIRQYIGILAAIVAYYLVHEGAHLSYALFTGVFRQIKFMGLGVQVDVFRERMTDIQLGIFCLVGALLTFCIAYLLIALAKKISNVGSKLFRTVSYYITIALLFIDPFYLSILCSLFGGGDMKGIVLLVPKWAARFIFGVLLVVNGFVFWKKEYISFNTRMATPVSERSIVTAIKTVIRRINKSRTKDEPEFAYFSPHTFRHTFAARCFENGMQPKMLQEHLGHNSLEMTMDLYTHVTEKMKRKEAAKIAFIVMNPIGVKLA